jgi:hypothetical protein
MSATVIPFPLMRRLPAIDDQSDAHKLALLACNRAIRKGVACSLPEVLRRIECELDRLDLERGA